MELLNGGMKSTPARRILTAMGSALVVTCLGVFATAPAQAQTPSKKPNIVVIMADDVGVWNVSAYHRGMMGGSTPNIDRIAKEGALFTDYYAQQSCTAGRAAFILGQTPFRTGLLKVGLPAAKQGLQDKDPTIAELLKPHGYATAQIGKNHLGDRNEYLPTVHGFDEFYGILYHLNAMEEPYQADYPKDPKFRAMFGPRNIIDSKASTSDDATTSDADDASYGTTFTVSRVAGSVATISSLSGSVAELEARITCASSDSVFQARGTAIWYESVVTIR
jgi:arylsulfatase